MNHQEIARKCIRGLALEADKKLHIDLRELGLKEQIESLADSAGAQISSEDAECAIVGARHLNNFLVPEQIVSCLRKMKAGSAVVIVLDAVPKAEDLDSYREKQERRLKLERCRIEPAGERCLIFGALKATLKSANRKKLRTIGHSLDPSILIGRSGLTESVVEATRTALERHGLIKIKLTPQSTEDKDGAAIALSWATGSHLVQRVGKTALLFREDVELAPPVKKVRRH
jgi:RNA-binding protein